MGAGFPQSARKHGFTDEEIIHAFNNAIRYVEYEYEGEERLHVIGATGAGTLLEIVAVDLPEPNRIIHAGRLRNKFYYLL